MKEKISLYTPTVDTPDKAWEKNEKERKKKKLQNKLARPESTRAKPDPEALAAVKELDKKQLESLRAKLAGVEPKNFPEGTQPEIELTEEDLLK